MFPLVRARNAPLPHHFLKQSARQRVGHDPRALECSVRADLATECSSLLAGWLASKDAISMCEKDSPQCAEAVRDEKEFHKRLKAAQARYSQYVSSHGCR
jgi:hypothetical protein